MRVLHLIDQASPQACSTTLAMLTDAQGRLPDAEQTVLLLGGQPLADAAEGAQLKADRLLGVPAGRGWLGLPAVARAARQMGPFDLIHCWSVSCLSLASTLWRSTPRLLTLTQPVTPRQVHWLRIITTENAGRCVLLPISNTLCRQLLTGGVPEAAAHVLRPGLDMGRPTPSARRTIRQQWDAEASHVKVVALLGDPPTGPDATTAMLAVQLARTALGEPMQLRLLMHGSQHGAAEVRLAMQQLGASDAVLEDDRLAQPWSVLPACDAALAMGPTAGNLSLLWAMASGTPIVAEATYAASEIVEDRHSALLSQPDEPRSISHRLERLLPDRHLAWELRDTARHEAYSFFSRQRYCQSLMGVYEQTLAGQPIEIPDMPITGGLRFSGRA